MTSSPHVQKQCWEEQKEQELGDALRVFSEHKSCEYGDINFLNCRVIYVRSPDERQCDYMIGAPQRKFLAC